MYISRRLDQGRLHYSIRESYPDHQQHCMRSRLLVKLGENPANLLVYPGGNSFYIEDWIEEEIHQKSDQSYSLEEIEALFQPFIRPDIKTVLADFRPRKHSRVSTPKETFPGTLHLFDRRRLHYLRCGSLNQRGMSTVPDKFFHTLINKSRDELEQHFMLLETHLTPETYKEYTFVIFNLQQYFSSPLALRAPEALNDQKIDDYFLAEICWLAVDHLFWAGDDSPGGLPGYLQRYAIMFFDYGFQAEQYAQNQWQNFINQRRVYKPPAAAKTSSSRVKEIFTVELKELQKMSPRELTKLYRQRAKTMHPDVGGDHDSFVELTAAYYQLMSKPK